MNKESTVHIQSSQELSKKPWRQFNPQVVVIASSTGGPNALATIFKQLTRPLRVPILIVQHMPADFTTALAERLARISGQDVREAVDGEEVVPGRVYIAPGDYHMVVEGSKPTVIRLHQGPKLFYVRPAADELFRSATQSWKSGCMGIVLTGMGEDGARGAQQIKNSGGVVAIQDQASCVVFGMPGATMKLDAYDQINSIDELAMNFSELVSIRGNA